MIMLIVDLWYVISFFIFSDLEKLTENLHNLIEGVEGG